MKVSKALTLCLVLFSICFTSCSSNITEEDKLYEDAIRKDEIKDQDVG